MITMIIASWILAVILILRFFQVASEDRPKRRTREQDDEITEGRLKQSVGESEHEV